jgi:hypothetical protein
MLTEQFNSWNTIHQINDNQLGAIRYLAANYMRKLM